MNIRQIIKEELKKVLMEKLPKGKWSPASSKDLKDYDDEIYQMIKKTYEPIGGHPGFKSPSDVNTTDADKWDVIDVDGDTTPDAVSAAKTKKAGKKFMLGATDGSKEAKRAYIMQRINALKKPGNFIEASHKIADILAAKGVPVVDDEQVVRKALGKDINWIGDGGYYERNIGGKTFKKRMFGKPKV
jgi:hypothetical protein